MAGKSESRSHRPGVPANPASSRSTAKIILLGSGVLLLGILGMIALRFSQMDDAEDDAVVQAGPMTDGVSIPVADNAVTIDNPNPNPTPETPETPGNVVEGSPDNVNVPDAEPTDVAPVELTPGIKNEIDSDRGRRMMAGMVNLATDITGFPQDSREVIREAVNVGLKVEIDRCRLTHRAGNIEPVMNIRLDVRQKDSEQTLWMSAELLATDGNESIRVWARTGSVAPLSDQALNGAIVPPNFPRDIANFFRSLRGDFEDARRQFGS